MLSAFTDPDLPPLLSPESQQPGLLSLAGAKFKGMMQDPTKKVGQALFLQQLQKMGPGLLSPGLIQKRPQKYDMYGNLLG